jgi:DNA-directed RNA polymerase sigma subunit (sigma70/sigma32)
MLVARNGAQRKAAGLAPPQHRETRSERALRAVQTCILSVKTMRSESDPVTMYLREVCSVPPMTRAEELELSAHVLGNDKEAEAARRRLIEANLANVVSIAETCGDRGVHVLDLIQKGNEALFFALQTFPQNPAKSFSAHATECVTNAIVNAIAES